MTKILGHDVPISNTYDRTEKPREGSLCTNGDVFQRGLFVLAPDKGPYKQKFENADPLMDAKLKSSRLYKKTQHFPIL